MKGRNNIRIGFSVEAIRNNQFIPAGYDGTWRFGSIRDFLTDVPQQFNAALPGADAHRGIRAKVFGLYIQDDLRLRHNLTLNLGLRYEPTTTVSEVNGKFSRLKVITDPEPTIGNLGYQNRTKRNFSPRVGLAWDPSATGKTAIRSGFGIYYVPPLVHIFQQALQNVSPYAGAGQVANPPSSSFPTGAFFSMIGDRLARAGLNVEQEPRSTYKMQWNLNFKRQIVGGLSLMAGYVGNRGIHLVRTPSDVATLPPSLVTVAPDGHLQFPVLANPRNNRINTDFGRIRVVWWDTSSTYHGLQVSVMQQMSHGFRLQGSYAWSKSIDDQSTESSSSELLNTSDSPYPWFVNLNRAVSDFDISYNLNVNFLWTVPSPHFGMAVPRFLLSGWELSGILAAQTGPPFTVDFAVDRAGTRVSTNGLVQRPDFNPATPGCSSPNAVNPGNPDNYVRLECFAFPARNQLGNLGRNTLRGPGMVNFDFSLFKNNNLMGEKLKVQFRAEFYNLFNRTNYSTRTVSGFNSQGLPVLANSALRPPTTTSSRQVQVGMKFIW